ncbi:hypothetical protein HT574_18355 [Parageobacillus sp. VR-IP]|jgi:hypothetical protein|uniref:Uncharacterized protein n=1 Tax=Geobacillus stearothermophilus TaxID=1422 RepID=A0A916KNL1_GEOSE|nr:hypothetical protein [Parageobacillus sp. VR-IP]KZM56297.1 hypothetical protein A3Q36_06040 [Geobacillus stearothermophilus]NUK31955.1 hypothetical protein [Parageobacillus sp. VR-IP]CAP08241.1 hypothetical protein pGS18_ORF30 [Geobacillus stearothermophilus]
MLIIHILIGIIFGYIIWKLLKVTFKSIMWLLLIGLIVAFIFPKALFLVGGIGFLVLSTLGVLLILSLLGFFFFEND